MQSIGVPRKGDLQYSLDLGQNDPVHIKHKKLNLTISRTNRRKSIEDSIVMSNMKFRSSDSHVIFGKQNNELDSEKLKNNTFISRIHTEDDTNVTEEIGSRALYNKSQMSPDLNVIKSGSKVIGSHNRYSNRSFDNAQRYSPSPEVTYK